MHVVLENKINLQTLISALKDGQTIVYPTETCYGLGCDATNEAAVEKIFQIKGRAKEKGVLVLVPDVATVKEYAIWTPTAERVADRYWPGPVTMVLPLQQEGHHLARGVVSHAKTAAFRMSDHPLVRTITENFGRPLVSTSANMTGMESAYDIPTVLHMFEKNAAQPDIIIDAGVLPRRPPSTLVAIDGDTVRVLRQGEILVAI